MSLISFKNVLETFITMVKNFGVVKTIGLSVIFISLLYTVIGVSNMGNTIKEVIYKNQQETMEAHDKAVEKRYENSPKIDQLLNEVMYRYGADRVCVVEMHNGTKNVAGLPFIYGEMTYEICRDGVIPVDADYTQFNLSRLSFPSFMFENNTFCGDMSKVSTIDEKFAERLLVNNTTYLCGYTLHGSDNVIGYFGVIWCSGKPEQTHQLMRELGVYAQRLSVLLNEN